MPVVVGVLKETAANENRVAIVPEVAAKLTALGAVVLVQSGAGVAAQFPDKQYSGVEFADAPSILSRADVLLTVQPPDLAVVAALKAGAVVPVGRWAGRDSNPRRCRTCAAFSAAGTSTSTGAPSRRASG